MSDIFSRIALYGIVPVINVPDADIAVPLVDALEKGGLPLIEVTLRNPNAIEAIACIKKERSNIIVGAGTILSVEQVDQAIEAGADFAVSPGLNPKVVEYCIQKEFPILPGCATATEVEMARSYGLCVLKFFPSEQMGGVKTIKELCGPYKDIKFVTTSGITLQNLPSYLSYDGVAAVGGSFMAPAALVASHDWEQITKNCKIAIKTAMGFHLAHVGINGKDEEDGAANARRIAQIFGMEYRVGGRSDFAGDIVESCKVHFPGEKGHIAIGTCSVERAIAYLECHGIAIRDEFLNKDEQGRMIAAYLEEEIGGFAIHLLKRPL